MRVLALTVGHNEEKRYLKKMLQHTHQYVDGHFFYDDRSTDRTASIAAEYARTVIRPHDVSSFALNEGAFREAAWYQFEQRMVPEVGDWVLVIDCDEFLIVNGPLKGLIADVLERFVGIDLNIKEVFGRTEWDVPLVRIDRLWGTIHAPRLFRYQPNGSYAWGEVGVPAVPSYAQRGPWANTEDAFLAHYGYATQKDQETKYARYSGRGGHSNAHVQSILAPDKVLIPGDWVF